MAKKFNLQADAGSSFYQQISLTDQNGDDLQVNLANGQPIYTAAGQIRKSTYSANSVTFTTAIANGVLTLTLSANTTANIEQGRYMYDVELTTVANGYVTKVMAGIFSVKSEATKI